MSLNDRITCCGKNAGASLVFSEENELKIDSEVVKKCQVKVVRKMRDGAVHLGKGIIKVDSWMNHQVDTLLMNEIGQAFASYFSHMKPTKVVTIVSSGILPAQPTAFHLKIPLIYARNSKSITFSKNHKVLEANSMSHTKGKEVKLFVSGEFLTKGDRVLVIDDVLASGTTLKSVHDIIQQAEAELVGVGVIFEKSFEEGWKNFCAYTHIGKEVKLLSMANVTSVSDGIEVA